MISVLDCRHALAATVLAIATGIPTAAYAAWTLRDRTAGDPTGSLPIATVTQKSHALEVQVDARDVVWLQFRTPATDAALTSAQCPTFQIDQRLPLIHPALGGACAVTARSATLEVGKMAPRAIVSSVLYALVNGNHIAVRYVTDDRKYREAVFSLRHSKRAVKKALGGRRIRSQ